MIAALFVMPDGPYAGLPEVDLWDQARDARLYAGPHGVVAHPPCERWGRYWDGGPSARVRRVKGDDNGCFASALASVRKYGGVLEHPAGTLAWPEFGLIAPPRFGGWVNADWLGGWVCWVDQGNYGHRAPKPTWLYANGCKNLPSMNWGKSPSGLVFTGKESAEERKRKIRTGVCQNLSKRQRTLTPIAFRDALIDIAKAARHEV